MTMPSRPQAHVVVSDQAIFVSIQSRLELIGRLTDQIFLSNARSVLTSSESLVLLALAVSIRPNRMTETGEPIVCPSVAKLMERSKLGRSSVFKATKTLLDKGFVRLVEEGGGREANSYALVWLDGDEPPAVQNSGLDRGEESATRTPPVHVARASGPPGARHPSRILDCDIDHERGGACAPAEAEEVKKLASAAPGEREEVTQLLHDRGIYSRAVPALLSKCPWLTAEYIRKTDEHRVAVEAAGKKIEKVGGWYYSAIVHRYADQQQQLRLFAPTPKPLPHEPSREQIRRRREREIETAAADAARDADAFVNSLPVEDRKQLMDATLAATPAGVRGVFARSGLRSQGLRLAMHQLHLKQHDAAADAVGELIDIPTQGGL